MRKIPLALFLLLASKLSFSLIIRHDINPKLTEVNDKDFQSVLKLRLKDNLGTVEFEGVLVQDHWILTCAHFADEGIIPNQSLDINGLSYKIDTIAIHPQYEGWDHDLALIRLEEAIINIEPSRFFENKVSNGDLVWMVGVGSFRSGTTGPVINDGIKRKATNLLTNVTPEWLFMQFDSPNSPDVTSFEGVSGPGNSGGPIFVESNGSYLIVGISSHSETAGMDEGVYGTTDIYTNIVSEPTQKWIFGTIEGLDYLDEMSNPTISSLMFNLPTIELGQEGLEEIATSGVLSKLKQIKKRIKGSKFQRVGKGAYLFMIYDTPENKYFYKVTFGINDKKIDNINLEKIKLTSTANESELPRDLVNRVKAWGLPENYVALRITDFFAMCLNGDTKAASEEFVNEIYESFPGTEDDSMKFFESLSNKIGEIRNVKIVEFKKGRGTIKFSSGETVWELGISVNKTQPYKINGLTINR